MIKVRYVAQVEVNAVVLNERIHVPVAEIAERIRGEWITRAIAEQVRDVFYDPRVKVTTQFADIVEEEKDLQNDGKTEG